MSSKNLKIFILISLVICFIFSSISISAQGDSIPNIIKVWKIAGNNYDVDSIKFDTTLNNIQRSNLAFSDGFIPSWLGNYGLASRNNFANFRIDNHFPFNQTIRYNTFSHANNMYFNTRKPITQIDYYNGGGKSSKNQFVSIFHTQNINPFFNAGTRIRYFSALGDYAKQEFRGTSFGLWLSYNKKSYFISADYAYNKLKNHENGGFENDSIFNNNTFSDPHFISTALNDAKAINRFNEINIVHGINLKLLKSSISDTLVDSKIDNKITLIHSINIKRNGRVYTDNNPENGYYSNIFLDSTITYDSSAYTTMHNSVYLKYLLSNKNALELSAGFDNYLENNYCYENDTITSSIGIFTRIKGKTNNGIVWKLSGKSYFAGYYSADYNINGNFKIKLTNDSLGPVLSGGIVLDRNTPSGFYFNYSSNNFIWDKQLSPMTSKQLEGKVYWKKYNLSAQAKTGIYSNYLYFNKNAIPSQLSSNFYFASVILKKEISLGKFRFNNMMLIQGVSRRDVIDIPTFSYSTSLFFQSFLLHKVLFAQLGLDAYYQSKFYAPAYMPATGIFYYQDDKTIGNYPFVDVFLNIKLKQVRFTFKYAHVNMGYPGNNYFSAFHYVAPQRRFIFGLKWIFYN